MELKNMNFSTEDLCNYERLHCLEVPFHHVDHRLALLPSVTAEMVAAHLQQAVAGAQGAACGVM